MSKPTKLTVVAALGLGIVAALPVLAYGPFGSGCGPDGFGPGPGRMHWGMMNRGAVIEQRLSTLKDTLKLTAQQQPAWDHFEQAVKEMVASQPLQHPGWGPAGFAGPASADAHLAQMEKRVAQMKKVVEARDALFDTLTPQQKSTVEGFFPPPPFGGRS
jgi:hypothetical protein